MLESSIDTALRDAVAEAEGLPWWFFRLPALLERNFNAQTRADRTRQLRFWIAVCLVLYWLCFGLDVTTVPDSILLSFWLRVSVMTPLGLMSIYLLGKGLRGWRQSLVAIASPAANILAQLCIFASSAHNDPLLDTVVLGSEVLWMNVLFPFRMGEALLFTLLAMGCGDAINTWSVSMRHGAVPYANVIIAAHGLVMLSVLSRAIAEQSSRRSFMQGLKLHLHVETLTRANATLLEMSNTDTLTGVANRRHFDRALDHAWQQAATTDSVVAMMMIDVDHFKLFNDTAGHLEGDRCLAILARDDLPAGARQA